LDAGSRHLVFEGARGNRPVQWLRALPPVHLLDLEIRWLVGVGAFRVRITVGAASGAAAAVPGFRYRESARPAVVSVGEPPDDSIADAA
jgi:hypothetical protein